MCASLQSTIIDILMTKLVKAAKATGIKEVAVAGGVSANSGLRKALKEEGERRGWNVYLPQFRFTTDNAAMIAISGYYKYLRNDFVSLDVSPTSRVTEMW